MGNVLPAASPANGRGNYRARQRPVSETQGSGFTPNTTARGGGASRGLELRAGAIGMGVARPLGRSFCEGRLTEAPTTTSSPGPTPSLWSSSEERRVARRGDDAGLPSGVAPPMPMRTASRARWRRGTHTTTSTFGSPCRRGVCAGGRDRRHRDRGGRRDPTRSTREASAARECAVQRSRRFHADDTVG